MVEWQEQHVAFVDIDRHVIKRCAYKPFIDADLVRTPDGGPLFAR
jgi:hypothetical protein